MHFELHRMPEFFCGFAQTQVKVPSFTRRLRSGRLGPRFPSSFSFRPALGWQSAVSTGRSISRSATPTSVVN